MNPHSVLYHKVLHPLERFNKEPTIYETLSGIKGDSFWDVGANYGFYSIMLRKNFKSIYAVEPDPFARRTLRRNRIRYRAWNVLILPFALAEKRGWAGFESVDQYSRTSHLSMLPQTVKTPDHIRNTLVETRSFDSFRHQTVDLLKIDVEGAEFMVLEGMKQNLSKGTIRRLIIEIHSERTSEITKTLEDYGYKVAQINGPGGYKDQPHLYAIR